MRRGKKNPLISNITNNPDRCMNNENNRLMSGTVNDSNHDSLGAVRDGGGWSIMDDGHAIVMDRLTSVSDRYSSPDMT